MSVAELTDLRVQLNRSSLEYRIVKNTLAKIASRDTSVAVAAENFKGPIGVAIGYDDPVLVAKRILEFTKSNEKLQVKGAVIEGKFCAQSEVKEIAELPSREILLSILAGVLQAPLSKMARGLSGTITGFAYAMDALGKTKKE